MLAPYLLAVVAVAIVVTSFISGVFGMAGGMLLLGLLLLFMDVAPAMVLFGIIQVAANSWRAILWWRHVAWSIVWRFLVGSTAMFLIMRTIAFLPSKAMIYLGLGLIPFAAYALPRQLTPDITRPGAPYVCGALLSSCSSGPGPRDTSSTVSFKNARLTGAPSSAPRPSPRLRDTSIASPTSGPSRLPSIPTFPSGATRARSHSPAPAHRWRVSSCCA